MNFYRVGKTVGVTANTEFFLNDPQYIHKAILFPNSTVGGGSFRLTFHDASTTSPLGITLAVPATAGSAPYIFPGVVRSILPGTTQRIVLLG